MWAECPHDFTKGLSCNRPFQETARSVTVELCDPVRCLCSILLNTTSVCRMAESAADASPVFYSLVPPRGGGWSGPSQFNTMLGTLGTLAHIHWVCEAHRSDRKHLFPEDSRWSAQGHLGDLLWERLLIPHFAQCFFPLQSHLWHVPLEAACGVGGRSGQLSRNGHANLVGPAQLFATHRFGNRAYCRNSIRQALGSWRCLWV